jgi:hypothetical protein
MSQRLSNSFVNTNIPGSYFQQNVRSVPVGVGSSGNVVIIGEAAGGASFSQEASFKNNFFTPDQLSQVISKYKSGNIVEAFKALASASSDAGISGSANRIYIAKTNSGSQASATLASAYGTLSDINYGIGGNKYYYQISQVSAEAGPSFSGATIAAFGAALTNAQFAIRENGGVSATINVLTGATTAYDTIAKVVALISAALPVGLTAVVGAATNSIKIEASADSAANQAGFGKSFELIETVSGDLALLGLTAGLNVSSQEPVVQLTVKRTDTNTNEAFNIAADVALKVGFAGTSGTMTISGSTLTTTVVGGANLNINLANFTTLNDLAAFINSQTNYSCSVVSGKGQLNPSSLDKVSAIGICSTAVLQPGRIKVSVQNFINAAAKSAVVSFSATATKGLPDAMANIAYLTGGTLGATTGAQVISAIAATETIDVNFVIPLFSSDASLDIAAGLTDSGSTYTITATNAAVKSSVLAMSVAKVKKHRQAFLSFWDDSFENAKAQAASLANARVSLCMQKATQVNLNGASTSFAPWYTACIAAGMQAAGFYKAIVNKYANVISFTDPSGFDSGSIGDLESALDAGLLFLEQAVVGNKWVSDQTTYGVDVNFVYNSIQAMYAADLVALDLSASFSTAFVGQSLADVDAGTALAFLASKMDNYKKQKLIAASADAPNGFKNASVSINGPIMEIGVEIKLASAIYFIPINIEISQVTSNA